MVAPVGRSHSDSRFYLPIAPFGAEPVEKIDTVVPIPDRSTANESRRIPRIAPTPARGVYSETGRAAGSAGSVAFWIGAGSEVGEAAGRLPRISASASRRRMRVSTSSQKESAPPSGR